MAKLERGNFNPESIRGALRQGDANVVQMFGGGTPAAGDAAIFDAAGNIIAGTSGGGYDLVFAYPGAPPVAYALWIISFTRTVTFAVNFGISRGACGTNPAAAAIYTVKKTPFQSEP